MSKNKMQANIFDISKDVFLDTVDVQNYIELDHISVFHKALTKAISKPLKMVLLYGKPGTGKSMFLSKLYKDLSTTKKIYLYKTPILDESEFYKNLAQDLLSVKYEGELNFTQFMKIIDNCEVNEIPIILLDEAQLYSDSLIEKIRLLSDTRKVKFVITLHKTEKEDLIAKEHFQTRIWEVIELKNSPESELKHYIQKKLLKESCFDVASMFEDKTIKLIYKFTKGNYRQTNKILYNIFDIYSWYELNNPKKINKNTISTKIVEMAAIHTGLLDV
jgi:replication-associated recombination protein RarA